MKIFSQNSKIRDTAKKHGVDLYNFGIPAFMSKDGTKTCPNAGACATGCYAQSGAYLFSNVAKVYEDRLSLTKSADFVLIMGTEIERLRLKALKNKRQLSIRVHDSGDFYSPKYQLAWYHIARAFPEVHFYAYTKQVVQSVALSSKQPDNFKLIYSQGGKQDRYIRAEDRHSRVFENETELTKAGYVNASVDDLVAIGDCTKIGLVFHHAKNYNNTQWSNVPLTT